MSNIEIFNSEMKKYFASNKNEIAKFLNKKFKESSHTNYYTFFDGFLFNHGIISFSLTPFEIGNKYIPYLNCKEKNIFNEKEGRTDLNAKPLGINDCNKMFAKYFILKFNQMELKTLTEWNSENNRN